MTKLKKGITIILTIALIATTFVAIGTTSTVTAKGCKHNYATVYVPNNNSYHLIRKQCKKCHHVLWQKKENHVTKAVYTRIANDNSHVVKSQCKICGKITNHGYASHVWKNNKCTKCGWQR